MNSQQKYLLGAEFFQYPIKVPVQYQSHLFRPAPPAKFYQATDDVAVQILDIAQRLCNSSVEPATTLTSNHLKYQVCN